MFGNKKFLIINRNVSTCIVKLIPDQKIFNIKTFDTATNTIYMFVSIVFVNIFILIKR